MEEENKLTLDQMLELSKKVPRSMWKHIPLTSSHRLGHVLSGVLFPTTSCSSLLGVLGEFTIEVVYHSFGAISVDYKGNNIGSIRNLSNDSSEIHDVIKKRYNEITVMIEEESRKVGYEKAIKLLEGE